MARIKAKSRKLSLSKGKRDNSLDYLRGIAVLLMISAHVIHFISTGNNQTLRFIEGVANTICFTLFLFISGSVAYLAYLKEGVDFRRKVPAILRRIVYMLLGYYLLAFSASIEQFPWPPSTNWLSTAVSIFTFNNVPGFTEFIIPFIIISLLLLIFYPVFKFASKNIFLTITLSIVVFLIGTILFPFQVSSTLTPYKALFVGNFDYYRFPLVQYLPVFFFGLYWGHLVTTAVDTKRKEKIGFLIGLVFLIVFGLSELVTTYLHIPYIEPLNRWPPSIGFLAIGLAFAFFSIPIILNILKSKLLDPINQFFVYIGQDAFDMFIFSTFLLFLYRQVSNYQFTEIDFVVASFVITLAASMLLASFNSFHSASLFRKGTDILSKKQKIFRKRYVILAIVMMIAVFNNLKIPVYSDVAGAIITPLDIDETEPLKAEDSTPWWENKYGYYKQVNITNKHPFRSIDAGAHIDIVLDHKDLVANGKSLSDGSDIQIVYFTGKEFVAVPFSMQDVNTSKTILQIEMLSRIYPQKINNRYFIYYGNTSPEPHPLTQWKQSYEGDFEVSFGPEEKHAVSATLNRKWVLKSSTLSGIGSLILTVTLNDIDLANAEVTYNIMGSSKTDIHMGQVSPMMYQSEISASEFEAGEYSIQVIAKTETDSYLGQILTFNVSYPVFVSWTIDWEGSNENDKSLQQLAELSARHDVPLTHFFNPRIYLRSALDPNRAKVLTDWVKTRREPVELHLHMHKDMVEAAGVEYKDAPRWSKFTDMGEGYDIPMSEYSKEEVKKIMSWGVKQFRNNGLTTPTMYRAGGWFADADVLDALVELDFKVDSSGRVPEHWWEKYSYIWNLKDTTQPYKPSLLNQNSALPPVYDLWEFPNNGGDSTSYEASELIENFTNNWDGKPMNERTIVTYLSHPKWFDIDGPRMDSVFNYIDKFLFEDDNGPVVYIDLDKAYLEWTTE